MTRPDEMTGQDEAEAVDANYAQALKLAQKDHYRTVEDYAVRRYGYCRLYTTLSPAEFVLAQHRLWAARTKFQRVMDDAVARGASIREQDAIAAREHDATAYDERMVGA